MVKRSTCEHLGHTTEELHKIMMGVWYVQDGRDNDGGCGTCKMDKIMMGGVVRARWTR